MILSDILQFLLNAQVPTGSSCEELGLNCPGASYTAIAAAFTTQGYFTQSDLIHWLLYDPAGHLGLWAPLLYVFSAFGGMVGVATGMAPKNYMWFFLGPAFYHWLIGQPMQVNAAEWRVGDMPQDQREVWRLAEVGLVNTRIVNRLKFVISSDLPPTGGAYGDGTVDVAYFFAYYDRLISELTMWLIQWTGIHNLRDATSLNGGGRNGMNSNIMPPPGKVNNGGGGQAQREPGWILLSSLKWGLLEDITAVQIQNPDVRDAFINLLSSECGDILAKHVDFNNLVAARNSRGDNLPITLFRRNQTLDDGRETPLWLLTTDLAGKDVPIPSSLRNMFNKRWIMSTTRGGANTLDRSGFSAFVTAEMNTTFEAARKLGQIRCDTFFQIAIDGLRWEAGHAFHKLVNSKRGYVQPENIMYALFYGWGIKKPGTGKSGLGDSLSTDEEIKHFLQDMILAYLVRNELRIAPKTLGNPRYANSGKVEDYVQTHQRTIGEKSKYGELYSWATLVPYLQGVLLYMLAIGYPFACILIVVPGWHKTLFTWMSFWAWAKLWDVGFAVVGLMERSIWAMMGNNSETKSVSSMIAAMQGTGFGSIEVLCNNDGGAGNYGLPYSGTGLDCPVAQVCDVGCNGANATAMASVDNLLNIFERTVLLGNALDLDLANAYYIYIMAALYLAVPAVTGQLVLGAKSGVSGLISTAIGGSAGEAGRAAGAGFSSDMTQKAKANSAALGQASYFKGLREAGYDHGGGVPEMTKDGQFVATDAKTGKQYTTSDANDANINRSQPKLAGMALNAGNNARWYDALGQGMSANRELMGSQEKIFSGNYNTWNTGMQASRTALETGLGYATSGLSTQKGTSTSLTGRSTPQHYDGTSTRGRPNIVPGMPMEGSMHGSISPTGGGGGGGAAGAGGAAAAGAFGGAEMQQRWQGMLGENGFNNIDLAQRTTGGGRNFFGHAKDAFAAGGNIAAVTASAGLQMGAAYLGSMQQAAFAGISIQQYEGQAQGAGFGMAQSRLGAQAHFEGENRSWEAKNAYAQAVSGDLGAMGVSSGVVDPGPKPTHFEGAAMSGMLGGDVAQLAHFSDHQGSEFFTANAAQVRALDKDFGRAASEGRIARPGLMDTAMELTPFGQHKGSLTALQGPSQDGFTGTKDTPGVIKAMGEAQDRPKRMVEEKTTAFLRNSAQGK